METILVFVLAVLALVAVGTIIYLSILRSRDNKDFLAHQETNLKAVLAMHDQQVGDFLKKYREIEELAFIDSKAQLERLKFEDRRNQVIDRQKEKLPAEAFDEREPYREEEFFTSPSRMVPPEEQQ